MHPRLATRLPHRDQLFSEHRKIGGVGRFEPVVTRQKSLSIRHAQRTLRRVMKQVREEIRTQRIEAGPQERADQLRSDE